MLIVFSINLLTFWIILVFDQFHINKEEMVQITMGKPTINMLL